MSTKGIFTSILILLVITNLNGQVYVTAGANVSRINLIEYNRNAYDYGLGYDIGATYFHQINNRFTASTGMLFTHRRVKPIYDVNFYRETYQSSLVINNQNLVGIPLDLRTKAYKPFSIITGVNFNVFLNEIQKKKEKRIDTNLKLGIAYEINKVIIDAGYTFSMYPYRLNTDIFNYRYGNQSFFVKVNYQIF